MKVGVVIVTYNNSAHVRETVESVRSQTFKEWSCVIVDNGSTDNTPLAIAELIADDQRFAFFQKENHGPSSGRNFANRKLAADVEYVHFLDGDDKLAPTFLSTMIAYLDEHRDVGLLGCQFEGIDDHGNYSGPGFRSRYVSGWLGIPRALRAQEKETPFEVFFGATGQGAFAVFRKEVLDRTTGYEEAFWSHEDSDIFCQMALLAKVHYLPDRLYLMRTHQNNLSRSSKADYGKFRKKWDFFHSTDEEVNRKVEDAFKHYYGVHAPLRHFKTSLLAGKDFVKNRESKSLKWCLRCFRKFVLDLLFRKELRKKWKERLAAVPGGNRAPRHN